MFQLNLETEGLQTIERVLSALQSMGSQIGSVELHTISRKDADATNAEILKWLKNSGRDFLTQSSKDNEEVAQAFCSELERVLGKEFSEGAVIDRWEARGAGRDLGQFTTELADRTLRAAMTKYADQISERIDDQRSNTGEIADLSDAYKDYKQKAAGFIKPIGKFTGQLMDNLNAHGPGRSKIRVKRR